jgi:hypothetical protein
VRTSIVVPETPFTPEDCSPFEKLLGDLVRGGVEFAVVGGVAFSLNGLVRATDDVDILVQAAPEDIRKLPGCLAGRGENWSSEVVNDTPNFASFSLFPQPWKLDCKPGKSAD